MTALFQALTRGPEFAYYKVFFFWISAQGCVSDYDHSNIDRSWCIVLTYRNVMGLVGQNHTSYMADLFRHVHELSEMNPNTP